MSDLPPVRPGVGVDSRGGAVIDPTENVIALVKAGEVTNAALRAADQRFLDAQLSFAEKFQNFARDAESRYSELARRAGTTLQDSLRDAESRRIDQLASTRQEFQNTIRDMLAESVRSTSTLVSEQLKQIQATFDSRVTKLEASQLTQAGRSSVADPQTEQALRMITNSVASLKTTQDDALTRFTEALASLRLTQTAGRSERMGMTDSNARLLAVVMAISVVAALAVSIVMPFIHHA